MTQKKTRTFLNLFRGPSTHAMLGIRFISRCRFSILAIESSCDDTCVALMKETLVEKKITHSSINRAFRGVFPFLISACHEVALAKNMSSLLEFKTENIESVCYTVGPGQAQSLMRGFFLARICQSIWNSRLIPVHHMEGHIYSADIPAHTYPFLAILLSGGHTLIVLVSSNSNYVVLARSIDDNIGEAYDKIARELPSRIRGCHIGGSAIEKNARLCKCDSTSVYEMSLDPNPSIFSYSGIKSEVMKDLGTAISDDDFIRIACKFQRSVLFNLNKKLLGCWEILKGLKINPLFVTLGGGVSCNEAVRETVKKFADKSNIRTFFAPPDLCTDNASMIAKACHLAQIENRPLTGQLNPISEFPLGFLKDDDEAMYGYIST